MAFAADAARVPLASLNRLHADSDAAARGHKPRPLIEGIACALGAGLLWGFVFIVPLILPEYPPAALSFGRYIGFGIIAVFLASADLPRLRQLGWRDWRMAAELALVGNILYYLFLSAAVQRTDAPLPTMIVGTLPVVITIVANLGADALPWPRLLPALLVTGSGIALVNQHEIGLAGGQRSVQDHFTGALLALAAVGAWTWYPIRNARWLREHPGLASGTWAVAQGLATLPMAVFGMALTGPLWAMGGAFDYPLGPDPLRYIALMLALGLCASWLGTLLWNRACRLLPTALSGQLIVFETLAAFAYAFVWRGTMPGASALVGITLLITGVVLGIRAFHTSQQEAVTGRREGLPETRGDPPGRLG